MLISATSFAQSGKAQISKGHQILIDRGFQILGLTQPDNYFHLDTYTNAGYTTVAFSFDSTGNLGPISTFTGEPPGLPWARWALNESSMPGNGSGQTGNGSTYSRTNEIPHLSQLVAIQLGDEWNLNDDATRNRLVDWFNAVRNDWPNAILYHNNWGYQIGDAQLADFINRAHPDMINFDTYPWESVWDVNAPNHIGPAIPGPGSFQLKQWYSELRQYREYARASGIPMGIYRQIWHGVQDYDQHVYRDPSPSELRLNTYGALAFSAKFLNDFFYNTSAGSMFTKIYNGSGDTQTNVNGLYAEMSQLNKQVLNWGNTLVRLTPITVEGIPGYTTSMMFIRGKAANGNLTTIPDGFQGDLDSGGAGANFTDWVYQRNDPYLTNNWSVTNAGSKNNGLPGDVIISWFKPLNETFDGPDYTEERYVMVVNGLSDPTGNADDCTQEIKLNFASKLLAVEMLNPLTGIVEVVPLPLTNGLRQLVLNLGGGDAALFKFADGAPFVGAEVIGAPVLAQQPASRTNVVGSDATFSVTPAGASPFSFQWRFNGADISGATAKNFTRTNVQPSDAGGYSVVISNGSGGATSAPAQLTVFVPPQVTTQPQNQTISAGANALFSVTVTGNPAPEFQWRFNGTNVPGAQASTYTRANVSSLDSGDYSVLVSNAVGTIVSSNAQLTVNGPPSITGQPQNKAVLVGTSAAFSVSAVGPGPLTYRWRKNNIDLSDSAAISGATTATLTVGNVQVEDVGNYSAVVSNSFGSAVSALASLTIATQPTIQTQPQSRTTNSGSLCSFNVVASGNGLTYQWKRAGTNLLDGGNISGANTEKLTLNPAIKFDASSYTVAISNAAGGVISSPATLTILNPLPWREPFNYSAGSNLGGQMGPSSLVWSDVGTSTAGPFVTIDSGNLLVTNLAPSVGNRIRFGGLGKSARLSFSPVFTAGTTTYFSFALNVADLTGASASGGLIAGFNNSTGTQGPQPSVIGARVYLRTTSGGFNLGIAKNSDTDWFWDPRVFSIGETIFLVGSYTLNSGSATDDVAKLWINPNPADFGTAAAPLPSVTAATGNDLSGNVASFVFFQRSSTIEPAVMYADELRVGNSWASVTPVAASVRIESQTWLPDGNFQLRGSGDAGHFVLEASSDLMGWVGISNSFSAVGTFDFMDQPRESARYYRVRLIP